LRTKLSAAAVTSLTSTPIITTRPLGVRKNLASSEVSFLHGTHQEAKKLTTTGRPG
jgi:hypothetical protein